MSLRCILIDDEPHARENLRMLMKEYCPSLDIVGEGHDVTSGLEAIAACNPEVVFLDIRMPSGSEGFELLSKLPATDFMVVFVTAFKDYAIDAFKVNAVDYILKPIDIDELVATVDRLQARHSQFMSHPEDKSEYQSNLAQLGEAMILRSERIAIAHSHGVKLARINELVYLQAESNCTRLVFKDGSQYLDTRTLKVYESLLEGHAFFRIHRSYIIHLNELEEFSRQEGAQVKLRGGYMLPVARSVVPELLELINSL